jgi:hypothetical protein
MTDIVERLGKLLEISHESQRDLMRLLAEFQAREDALTTPLDHTALDTMLKQAKREQAEACFYRALLKSNGYGVPGILEELRRMAEELK